MLKNSIIVAAALCLIVCDGYTEQEQSPGIASTEFGEIHLDKFINDYQSFLAFTGVKDNMLFRSGVLKSEVDRLFLLNYALETRFDNDPAIAKKINSIVRQTLLNEFYYREIADGFHVSDNAVREAFRRSKIDIHARHLYAKTLEEAKLLKVRLDQGETFGILAREIFDSQQLAESGGDLGYFSFDDMDPAFENVAYSLKDGEVSDPVKTAMGYSIIQVLDRTYEPLVTEFDFQIHQADFLSIMQQRLLKDKVKELTHVYALQYKPLISTENLQLLFDHFIDIVETGSNIPKELRDIYLDTGNLTWDAEAICSHLRETTPNQRKQVIDSQTLYDMLTGLCVREYLFRNIESAGWRNDDAVLQKIKQAKEQRTITLLLDNVLAQAQAENDSINQKEVYLTFIEKLKTGAEIKINRQLLKSFRL